MSPQDAAAQVRAHDEVALPLGPGQPPALLDALSERDDFEDLTVFCALLVGLYPLFTKPGVKLLSGFFGPVERGLASAGADVEFVPADFRRFTHIGDEMKPRVMATAATPPDEEGYLSLSLHAGATVDQLHACGRDPDRLLIVEANAELPRTLGLPPDHRHALHVDEVDVLIEESRAPFSLPDLPADDVERAIAEVVRGYVPDGATLQTGIGGIPNAIVSLLAEGGGGNYGIHSEMFTDGLMRLHRAGKVTNQKGSFDGLSVCTFALGTPDLYRWLDGNDEVCFLPVELVNTPSQIARNRRFVSINGALAIDLAGQVVADSLSGRQFSGIGGHEDFVSGASFSAEGRSLICLPSMAKVDGRPVSRISAALPTGSLVTTPRHQVDVIVTEFGAAELAGKSASARRDALIGIAHPSVRKALAKGEGGA